METRQPRRVMIHEFEILSGTTVQVATIVVFSYKHIQKSANFRDPCSKINHLK